MQLWDLLPCLVMQEAPFSSRPRETLRKLTISQAHTGPPHLHSFQSNTLRNNDIPIVTRSSPICIFQQCYFNFQRVGNHSSVQGAGIQFKLVVSKILKEFRILRIHLENIKFVLYWMPRFGTFSPLISIVIISTCIYTNIKVYCLGTIGE